MSRRTARAMLAVATAVSLAACGGSDDDADPGAGAEPTAQACETRPATAEPTGDLSADLAERPEVPADDDAPPCDLVVTDIVVGEGAEAVPGATAAVKYVGAFYETGEEFDASWNSSPDKTLPVPLGAGRVIPGFEQGILGMQVGGRRMVTIPSDLGYGPRGQGPIPGEATLVFVMDLVDVAP